ncbi:MAG: pyruvate kinase [Flavobacteriales bacterium]|nr:pyruvate kinase [Flavobacteriales bacterium]
MRDIKRTKIVATIGPASSSYENLKKLVKAGMDVARVNFSHGEHETHLKVVQRIRRLNEEQGTHIAILGDLQGPKLRVGDVAEEGVELIEGQELHFTTKEPKKGQIQVKYDSFATDVKAGETILIDDGKLKLRVEATDGRTEVKAKVIYGGLLFSRKGVNLPDTAIKQPSLTPKDRKDLEFAIENDFDWIALSFVRSPRDILELKHIINDSKGRSRVIAKIEKPEALKEISDIIVEADGLMVARGDLGVEIPMQEVPLVQKMLIDKCRQHSKPVIVATQMMESMITNFQPTRAEVNDVANAVLDGTDAVMLSGETSVGQFPVEVVQNMSTIVLRMEQHEHIYSKKKDLISSDPQRMISDAICTTSAKLAESTAAAGIVTMTHSGYTANRISSYRPKSKIFVFTGNHSLLAKLSLVWGVQGFFYDKMVSTDHTIADIKYILKKEGMVEEGDLLINIASIPISEQGMTNMLKLSKVK